MKRLALTLLLACACGITTTPAWAKTDTDLIPGKLLDDAKKKKKKVLGWDFFVSLGGSVSFSHTQDVVGKTNGATFTFGFNFTTKIDYFKQPFEWRNTLTLQEQFSRTPALPRFTKSQDKLKFQSIFLYHVKSSWWGPFALVSAETAIFDGYDEREKNVTYTIGDNFVSMGNRLLLTKMMSPTTLKQTIGMFAQPYRRPWFGVEIRAGVGAAENFFGNGFALSDSDTTPDIVELKRLFDISTLGAEFQVDVVGVYKKLVSYKLEAEIMYPFYKSRKDTGLSGADLIHFGLNLKVGVKLAKWASLDYVFSVKRAPFETTKFQVSNGLLLTVAFVVVE